MARILVNDNSRAALELKNHLQPLGHQIIYTDFHGEEAVKKADEFNPDLILMDIMLKG